MKTRLMGSLFGCWICWAQAVSPAADVIPGSVAIGLKPVFNSFSSGISGISFPIDMLSNGDGRLFTAANSGQVIASQNGSESLFFDLAGNANVDFTSNFAGGLLGMAFHPDYHISDTVGYRKFYTFSSDWKTVNQSSGGSVSPGNQLTGLPDFWSPEMYAPATSGNPLEDWTNPDSPSPGNTDFDHFNIVREWTAEEDGLSIGSSAVPRELLRMGHGFLGKGSHNGGGIRFGPDGYLYITVGDGGGSDGKDYDGSVNNGEDGHTDGLGNGQDLSVVYGKVLRIEPNVANTEAGQLSDNSKYRIPSDNPFVNIDGIDEIFAYGFRNPWKIDFDDAAGGSGNLYLSDVGQHHREEIDLIVSGENYGWGYLEGNVRLVTSDIDTGEPIPGSPEDTDGMPVRTPPGGFVAFEAIATAPLVDYLTRRQYVDGQLVGDGTATTGGHVYRGDTIPALQGMYVFGDYSTGGGVRPPPHGTPANTGRLFYIDPTMPTEIFEFPMDFGADLMGQLLGFGRDDQEELYAFFTNGNVTRIVGSPDTNSNGLVDGSDFLIIQRTAPGLIPIWEEFFGGSFLPMTASTLVPESGGLALIAMGMTALTCFHRRFRVLIS